MESGLLEIVNGYLESHPNKSAMANKGDFDRKTLNRLMNGQPINSKSAFKILEVALKKDYFKIYTVLNKLYPEDESIASTLKMMTESNLKSPPDTEIEQIFRRSSSTQDLCHLLTRTIGVSRAFIQRRFGEVGVELVEDLMASNKVEELADGSLRFKNRNIAFSPETGKTIAIHNGVKYDTATFGTNDSALSAHLWNTNQAGFDGVKRIVFKAVDEAVLFLEAHPGDMPVSFSAIMLKAIPGLDAEIQSRNSNKNNIN